MKAPFAPRILLLLTVAVFTVIDIYAAAGPEPIAAGTNSAICNQDLSLQQTSFPGFVGIADIAAYRSAGIAGQFFFTGSVVIPLVLPCSASLLGGGATPETYLSFTNPASACTWSKTPLGTPSPTPVMGSVTVETNPTGRFFSVDSVTYSTSQTFEWEVGSSHTVSIKTPQDIALDTRYRFDSWSDGGEATHSIVVGQSVTYVANFQIQYKLTMCCDNAYGNVTPATNFFDEGESVEIRAMGWNFMGWFGTGNGSYTGPANPAAVIVNGPISETAGRHGHPTPTGTPTNTPTATPTTPTPTATPTATPVCERRINYAGPAKEIPDNDENGLDLTTVVNGIGAVSSLEINFPGGDFTPDPTSTREPVNHSWIGDLRFTLTSPSGTSVTFIDRLGVPASVYGCPSNNIDFLLIGDQFTQPVENQCPGDSGFGPLWGYFMPSSPLSAFTGENADGTWTLNVADLEAIDIGSVRKFDLLFRGPCMTPTPTPTPTHTPTATPTATPTFTPTATPTATPPFPSCAPGHGIVVTVIDTNFDNVTAPLLPGGWVGSNAIDPDGVLWQTSSSGLPSPPFSSAPNAAWINAPEQRSDKYLTLTGFDTFETKWIQLRFTQNFAFENGFDGGVLEYANILTGFREIPADNFVSGGYNSTISPGTDSPIAGRAAWSGSSGGFVNTIVRIPEGFQTRLRWRMATDTGQSGDGWRIDNVTVTRCNVPGGTPTATPTSTPTLTPTPTNTPTPTPTLTNTPTPTPTATPTFTPTATPPFPACGFTPITQYYSDFDNLTVPMLPAGAAAINQIDPDGIFWQTSNSGLPSPPFFSAPNAVWVNAPELRSDKLLFLSGYSAFEESWFDLRFTHSFDFENGFDGGVLEFASEFMPTWVDITSGGGSFVMGGYNSTTSSVTDSPIAGRAAWTGNSGGFITTVVRLPLQWRSSLRWRMATDTGQSGHGWRIDDVRITSCLGGNPTMTPTNTPTATPTPSITPTPTFSPTPTPTLTPTVTPTACPPITGGNSIAYGQTVQGNLVVAGCHTADIYYFSGVAGDRISIAMNSSDFDAFLSVDRPVTFPNGYGEPVAGDDNGGGGTNARIPPGTGYFTLRETAAYRIRASSVGNVNGAYELTLQKGPDPADPSDFDGDGRSDISVYRPSTGAWYIDQSTNGLSAVVFGLSSDRIVPADYDGDGLDDVAVYRPSTGAWYISNSSTGVISSYAFGTAEDIPTSADYDGDFKADISVFRPSTGTWYRRNSSRNGEFVAVQFGADGDRPTVGDFDGDRKADVAVFRPSAGTWYQMNSSDGSFSGEQFGISTDKIAHADYDGDGKTDIAIYRPSEGLWYVKQSATSTYVPYLFGLAEDIPVPGDFDGDGKADIAVLRPSTGFWYIANSVNGSYTIQHFGLNGDIPTQSAFGN